MTVLIFRIHICRIG